MLYWVWEKIRWNGSTERAQNTHMHRHTLPPLSNEHMREKENSYVLQLCSFQCVKNHLLKQWQIFSSTQSNEVCYWNHHCEQTFQRTLNTKKRKNQNSKMSLIIIAADGKWSSLWVDKLCDTKMRRCEKIHTGMIGVEIRLRRWFLIRTLGFIFGWERTF